MELYQWRPHQGGQADLFSHSLQELIKVGCKITAFWEPENHLGTTLNAEEVKMQATSLFKMTKMQQTNPEVEIID